MNDYHTLKVKLEELGYNHVLPEEAVPLVECILADLLQTTRSLQHYMDLSKEALMQRDSLLLEAEPYRCENAKLIQENNRLHKDLIELSEENLKRMKENKRKIKTMSDDLIRKDNIITRLQHELRDLSLRGICADTHSSRVKRKDAGDTGQQSKYHICIDRSNQNSRQDIVELNKRIQILEEKNQEYYDDIQLLKSQVDHRDHEIVRLNILLEGGRPLTAITKDCCKLTTESRYQELMKQIQDLESANSVLRKELDSGLEKQHEAMLRALNLADKNKSLQEEIQKVDALALKVEEDCNKRLAAMINQINFSQSRLESLTLQKSEVEKELVNQLKEISPTEQRLQDLFKTAMNEKRELEKEIKELVKLNKTLHEKLLEGKENSRCDSSRQKFPTKDELQILLENERKKYEEHIIDIQAKLTETANIFNKHMLSCKKGDQGQKGQHYYKDDAYVRDLHNKLCESEQKILMLKKEIDELKTKLLMEDAGIKQNHRDVIKQLNAENSELSKENIALSQQLSQYKNTDKYTNRNTDSRKEVCKLRDDIEKFTHEIQILRKDKQEYNFRLKESLDLIDKLKRDLLIKQKDIEKLQEENNSYKMSTRTDKASADHLKDECNFLREQIRRMQTDVIKEKTLSSQIKNIQQETERTNSEMQTDLLGTQKKLNTARDTIDTLEKKCKDLQSENLTLKNDKCNLLDTVKKVDQERDKVVIELDHKTENICVLEQKLKTRMYDISKLENEISELKRKLNINKISEHKLSDSESQIAFLNGEILRLTQQYDTALIENKQLQNSLADANGNLKLMQIEYEKSRKDVEGLKQQLQHYVAEIRRIEELLSHKEAERSDMLEQFASLSVEANILENTNHSLESESASKSLQLQNYVTKIQTLESKLLDKENIIEAQSTRIAAMTCKITSLENEIKLMTEEKTILEQNVSYLKKMCNNMQSEHDNFMKGTGDRKAKLEADRSEMENKLYTSEKLLSNARREIVELKLALQDATTETKSLQEHVSRLSKCGDERDLHESSFTEELHLPLLLEESIHEISHEEDEDSSRFHEIRKKYKKYTHGSTL